VHVVTWNLWWRFGDWLHRQSAIESVLAAHQADIYGLQEVWATESENFAQILAAQHGLQHVWAPSPKSQRWQQRLGDDGVQFGNAILSRWPIIDSTVYHLPAGNAGAADDEGRTLLFAQIDSPVGAIPMFTTQLNSQPQHSAIRCAQVRATAGVLAQHRSPDFPSVLTGDFNADPHSDESG
jgi:endonuclease/exonuclease/phosphatase family metal-dependent hydrolase